MNVSNVYSDSEKAIREILSGRVKAGSIIKITHRSGNSEDVRLHRIRDGKFYGCSMGWDNGVSEYYNLNNGIVEILKRETKYNKDDYWDYLEAKE